MAAPQGFAASLAAPCNDCTESVEAVTPVKLVCVCVYEKLVLPHRRQFRIISPT